MTRGSSWHGSGRTDGVCATRADSRAPQPSTSRAERQGSITTRRIRLQVSLLGLGGLGDEQHCIDVSAQALQRPASRESSLLGWVSERDCEVLCSPLSLSVCLPLSLRA